MKQNGLTLVMKQYGKTKDDYAIHTNYGYWVNDNHKFVQWASKTELLHILTRTYISIPYSEKQLAKDNKAWWDAQSKLWYILPDKPIPDALLPYVIDNMAVPLVEDITARLHRYNNDIEMTVEAAIEYLYKQLH